jgi:hypothetical protein
MNDELRRKAVIRKVTYFGVILALFVVSMFWRGVFKLPIGNPENAVTRDETGKLVQLSTADRIARLPIAYQAEDLELRERDAGDPEVAGSLAQVSLVGVRGFVVTYLWNATTTAQKRGEYHEMERNALLLTKVQPHFITPWVFQAWNIAYNVSVETDKLGDQYYYIARGISLLAEGDRANTRPHRRGKDVYMVGSPDLRYQLGFFAQNKFSVSDKVATLYSLSQLSLIPPDERDPQRYRTGPNGLVDPDRFREFCEKNPQLARRLKTKLNLNKPEQVMDFLEANWRIPARYDVDKKVPQPDDKAFPVFPVADEGADPRLASYLATLRSQEEVKSAAGGDAIDIRMVARAWFEHALSVVPPPKDGVPAMSPRKDEYDRFRYRIPERPALIVVRYAPARAQNYVAERLQKEGWFDANSEWAPDANVDRERDRWFPAARPREAAPLVVLKAGTSARGEWEKSHALWLEFGRKNGLNPENRFRQEELALATVAAGLPPLGFALSRDYSDEELAKLRLTREHLAARDALRYYDQNRQITQYQKFVEESLAEMEPDLAAARQLMWDADELHARNDDAELPTRIRAAAQWRRVLTSDKHKPFYSGEASDGFHEASLEHEMKIADLLVKSGDPELTRRVTERTAGFGLLSPALAAAAVATETRRLADEEAQARIALGVALADPKGDLRLKAEKAVREFNEQFPNSPVKPTLESTARGLLDGEFAWMKEYSSPNKAQSDRWVKFAIRATKMMEEGTIARPELVPEQTPDGKVVPRLAPGSQLPDR